MNQTNTVSAPRTKTYEITMTALMAAVTCILAPLSIPIGPVPISFTNLAIYLSLYLLGWKKGTISYLIYLLLGLVGLPVFSNGNAGFGVLAGPNPAEARAGLEAAVDFIENEAHFVSANDDDSIPYYAHCISRTGSYLSSTNGIKEGEALAYLIAPPLEAMYALDAAIKAADVTIVALYNPPSETNFGGGLLTGSQSACKAACNAFAEAVEAVAANPLV